MKLEFDDQKYEVREADFDGKHLVYRAFENLPYAETPADEKMERLSIYAPEELFKGADIHSAPIFMPNTVGGYMPGPQEAPGLDFMGRVNATFHALVRGYVVVSAGVRGRGMKNENGRNIGVAPADIVDLKAAVRYLRHFADWIPGDTERIITNGTSAGGAMSSLQGCTGNHPDYEPYLRRIGAAVERDDVFASSCYCPITNLDHADMAYEWEFCGLQDYHHMHFEPPVKGETKPHLTPVDGIMTADQIRWSEELRPKFAPYVNSLHLTAEDGIEMRIEADGSGTFRDEIAKRILASADAAMAGGAALAADPKVVSWLEISNGHAVKLDWNGLVKYRTRMKEAPAFDSVSLSTPENQLFGTAELEARHFTQYSAAQDHDSVLRAEEDVIRMMNPMGYINDGCAVKARHFRIRHGAADRDTSLAISNLLVLTLQNAGIDAELAHPWGVPHSGDYDLPDLFAWMDRICGR